MGLHRLSIDCTFSSCSVPVLYSECWTIMPKHVIMSEELPTPQPHVQTVEHCQEECVNQMDKCGACEFEADVDRCFLHLHSINESDIEDHSLTDADTTITLYLLNRTCQG